MARVRQSEEQAKSSKTKPEQKVKKMEFGTLPLSEDLKKRAKEWVLERYKAVYSDWQARNAEYDKQEKQYWGTGGVARNYQSDITNLFIPETFKHTEGWKSLIMNTLHAVAPPVKPKRRAEEVEENTLNAIADTVWYVARETKVRQVDEKIIGQGVKYGTFAYKIIWDMTEVEQYEKKKGKDGEGNNAWLDDFYSTPRDMPVKAFVDLRNLIYRADIEKPSWVIERIVTQQWKIDNQAKQYNLYDNLDKAKKTVFPKSLDPTKDQKEIAKKTPTAKIEELDEDVELFEYHGLFDIKKNGRRVPCLITLYNREEVIRVQKSPYFKFPYKIFPFLPVEGSCTGKGIPELIRILQGELNDAGNQGFDNKTFMLYCMVAYNEQFIKNKDDLDIRPKGRIRVKGNKNIQEVLQFHTPPNFTGTVDAHINRIKGDITDLTKMRSPMLGVQTSPRASATEVASIIEQSTKEVALILRRLEENLMEEYFTDAFQMIQQNIDRAWWVERLHGEEKIFEQITPEQLYANVVFEAQGVFHIQNIAVAVKSAQNTLALLQKYAGREIEKEPNKRVRVKEYAAIEDVLRAEGIKDIDRYFIPVEAPPPPPPMPSPEGVPRFIRGATPRLGAELGGMVASPPPMPAPAGTVGL